MSAIRCNPCDSCQWTGLDFIFQFSTSTTQSLLLIILLASVKRVNIVLCSTQTEQNSMDTRDWNQVKNISRKNNLKIIVIILSAFIYLLELVSFSKNAISQLIGSNCELQPLATIWSCVFQFYIKPHSSLSKSSLSVNTNHYSFLTKSANLWCNKNEKLSSFGVFLTAVFIFCLDIFCLDIDEVLSQDSWNNGLTKMPTTGWYQLIVQVSAGSGPCIK